MGMVEQLPYHYGGDLVDDGDGDRGVANDGRARAVRVDGAGGGGGNTAHSFHGHKCYGASAAQIA